VGVAGTKYLFRDNPLWNIAGRPFLFGRVIHAPKDEEECYLTVFSEEEGDGEVVAVDGLFFAARRSLFEKIKFDQYTFDGFHFYDLDICMQARKTHRLITTHDILVKHKSWGRSGPEWEEYGKRFLKKYRHQLPLSIGEETPDIETATPFENLELGDILSSETLHYINNIEKEDSTDLSVLGRQQPIDGAIVVTGMHRSGTSCIMGLLARCGYSLGTSHRLIHANVPQFDNQRGHFENVTFIRINQDILEYAGGSWATLPPQEAIEATYDAVKDDLLEFCRVFDGHILKDPRFCVTLPLWRECLPIRNLVICLRNPMSVARSLKKRNGVPLSQGLKLWYEYNLRLTRNLEGISAVVIDYDRFQRSLEKEFCRLLEAINSPITKHEIREKNILTFYEEKLNHNPFRDEEEPLPTHIKKLYETLKSGRYHGGAVGRE
jgi:hypothetical protein